jgi:DNA-binding NarL/FixJ family response regulator
MNVAGPTVSSRTAKRIGVLLAEDNEDLAEMLRASIEQEPDLKWVGCVNTVAALRGERPTDAAVVVLDLELGGESSLPHLPQLRESMPDVAFVIFSGHNHPPLIRAALEAGASRYVVKSEGLDALLRAIRESARGTAAK